MAGEDVVDEVAVSVVPDTSRFRAKLKSQLLTSTRGLNARIGVKVDTKTLRADLSQAIGRATRNNPLRLTPALETRGFRASVTTAIEKATARQSARVPIKLDTTGFRTSVQEAIKRATRGMAINVPVSASNDEELARVRLRRAELGLLADQRRLQAQADNQARRAALDKLRLIRAAAGEERSAASARLAQERAARQEAMQRFRLARAALIDQRTEARDARQAAMDIIRLQRQAAGDQRRAAMDAQRAADREERAARNAMLDRRRALLDQQRAARDAERESQQRARNLTAGFRGLGPGSTLIDMGAEGVKPTRLLIAAGLALSPVLVAVGSSAGIAATSVAALGSAGLGAVAGIGALTFGLSGILDVLKLKEQADKDATSSAAGLAATQLAQARAVKTARDQIEAANLAVTDARERYEDTRRSVVEAIAEERLAEQGLQAARREAAADLRAQRADLRGYALDQTEATLALDRAKYELRKFIERKGTKDLSEEDSFALRDARINVARAQERSNKVTEDRKRAMAEAAIARRKLTTAERTGFATDERVIAAQKRLVDARERVTDAQRTSSRAYKDIGRAQAGVVEAQENLTDVQAKNTLALGKQSAAASQLAEAYGKLSRPAQTLVDRFEAAEPTIDEFRRSIERAMVPGFLSFLDSMSGSVDGGASAFDVLGQSVVNAGRGIGSLSARLGRALRQPWFTGAMSRINRNNAKSFDLLGRATITSLRPIMKIIDAASPLLVRFGRFALRGAEGFDRLITSAEKTGDLARWFKTAGDELGKWWDIAANLGKTVYNVLKASFPAGSNLVDRLRDFTAMLRDWTGSEKGQKSIAKFFDFFAKIDYGQLFKTVGQITALFAAITAIRWTAKNPVYALMALLAAEYPEGTIKFIEGSARALGGLLRLVNDNPGAFAGLIGLFGAMKLAGTVGGFSLPKLIGTQIGDAVGSRLSSRGGFLGKLGETLGRKTAIMNVTAATVNILGGTGLPGKGGKPGVPPIVPGGKKPGRLGQAKNLGRRALPGLLRGAGFATALLTIDAMIGDSVASRAMQLLAGLGDKAGMDKSAAQLRKLRDKSVFDVVTTMFSPEYLKGLRDSIGADRANRIEETGSDPFSIPGMFETGAQMGLIIAAQVGAFLGRNLPGVVSTVERFFSHTLPDALNLGEGTGWAAMGANLVGGLERFFSHDLPNSINTGEGSGWAGLGTRLVQGTWEKVQEGWASFTGWIRDSLWAPLASAFKAALGIKSPSTKMMPFGADLINGLWVGVSTRLKAMLSLFGDAGEAVVFAITTPFALLGSQLATHFRAALAIMDSVFLAPVNTLLKTLKLTELPTLTKKPAAKRPATGVIRPAGRAEGGPIPGHSPTKKADNIPIMATAKEWMMPVDSVEHYGPGFMSAVQHKRLPKYANGGPVRGYANGGPIWPAMWNWVDQRFPQATLNSAQEGRNDPGYHPLGKAIDIGAPGVYSGTGVARDIFNAIKRTFFRNIKELIWDFAGSKAVWNGREHFFTGAGAGPGTHNDHIHWAMDTFAGAPGGSLLTGGEGAGTVDRFAGLVSGAKAAFSRARAQVGKSMPGLSTVAALRGTPAAVGEYALREATTFDSGGRWRPGTFGYNAGGGGVETVRNQSQEAALNNRVVRLDPRDLQKLANILIAAMTGQQINMDGHTVGEVINRQTYLPAGV